MQLQPPVHDGGERIFVHTASGHGSDFLKLAHQRGDDRVLLFEQIELRISRGPVLRPRLLVINQVGKRDMMPTLQNVECAAAQCLPHSYRQRQFPKAAIRASCFAFIPVQRHAPARRNKIIRRVRWEIAGVVVIEFPCHLDCGQQRLRSTFGAERQF
jgi:hypothetical protein